MSIVEAYQCPKTKKLFTLESKKTYVKHLKKLAAENLEYKLQAKRIKRFDDLAADIRNKVSSPFELAYELQNNLGKLLRLYASFSHGTSVSDDFSITKISMQRQVYRRKCSNSHSCPIDGVQNWGAKDGKPKWYKGIAGRISIKYTGSYSGFILTGALGKMGVCTGSGGGGTGGLSYDLTLWLDDFPKMKAEVTSQMVALSNEIKHSRRKYLDDAVIAKLTGKYMPSWRQPVFNVEWSEPTELINKERDRLAKLNLKLLTTSVTTDKFHVAEKCSNGNTTVTVYPKTHNINSGLSAVWTRYASRDTGSGRDIGNRLSDEFNDLTSKNKFDKLDDFNVNLLNLTCK